MDEISAQRFEVFAQRYQTALLRMCYVILRDHALAEDAVQETLIKAYRGWGTFRGDSSEKTWLMRIAVNTCRDMKRRAWWRFMGRRVSLEALPESAAPYDERDETILLAVMALPARQREVVLLRFYQDMTMEEIAQALGLSVSGVAGRLQRAKQTLRMQLEGGEQDE